MKPANVLKEVWKTMLPAACTIYISYFLYSGFTLYTARVTGRFVDFILAQDYQLGYSMLYQLGIALLISGFIMPLIDLIGNIIFFRLAIRHDKLTVNKFFKKRYDKMLGFSIGQASSRLVSDPYNFRQSVFLLPVKCLAYCTIIVITCIFMLRIHVLTSMIMFILIIGSLVITYCSTKILAQYSEQQKRYKEGLQSDLIDVLENKTMFKSYRIDYAMVNKLSEKFQTYYDHVFKKENLLIQGTNFLRELILLSCIGVLLTINIFTPESGAVTAGEVVTLYFYMVTIRNLINQVAGFAKDFSQIPKNIERMNQLIQDEEVAKGQTVPDNWNTLSFECVQFKYPSGNQVFSTLSCDIKQNEQVQLIGENGTGKSTFINLLCGLYSTSGGTIKLGNMPIEQYDMNAWRDRIAVINQFPDVFPGTVLDNVRLSKLESTDAEVKKVLSFVGLEMMSDRMLTGTRDELSGGEQKRLSLARLLLRDSPIVILDEPYENLDAEGRLKIDQLMLNKERTIIFVSHHTKHSFHDYQRIEIV